MNKKRIRQTAFHLSKLGILIIALLLSGCMNDETSDKSYEDISQIETSFVETTSTEELLSVEDVMEEESTNKKALQMEVHFIDVGEGDATLIKCGDEAMLIDAGDPTQGTKVRGYLKKQNVNHLKYLLLTHSDKDHIGGAPSVVSNIDIDEIFMCRYEKTNEVYQSLINEINFKSMTWRTPDVGEELLLGDAKITIIAPNREYDNPNDSSIAFVIRHEEDSFIFTGDAEESAEEDILENGLDISAKVYKVGHHGSRSSTSQAFLDAVNPSYAVVSCGADNDYGHPHEETLEKLKEKGVELYRTDVQGTIVAVSDGTRITFEEQPTDNWSDGRALDAESASTQVKQQIAEATRGVAEENNVENNSLDNAESDSNSIGTDDQINDTVSKTSGEILYVANTNSHKFHRLDCSSVTDIKSKNRWDTSLTREQLIEQGYKPCQRCNP